MSREGLIIDSGGKRSVGLIGHGVVATVPLTDTKPTKPQYPDMEQGNEWVDWGADNDWPKEARKKIEASSTAAPLIRKMISLSVGLGVSYGVESRNENGEFVYDMKSIDEVDDFLDANSIDRWVLEQLSDYRYIGNAFSEAILNKTNTKIVNLYHLDSEYTRLHVQNAQGIIPRIGYSANWPNPAEKEIEKVDLLNVRNTSREAIIKNHGRKKKFAYHTFYPSPGRSYYAMPPHGSILLKDGWLDYSNNIPKIMNAIMRNSMVVKWHIEIAENYWQMIEPRYDDWDQKKQIEFQKQKQDEMNKWLVGKENAGKAFLTYFATDPISKKPIPGITITPLKDLLNADRYIPSGQEADIHIARAVGADLAIAGIQPSSGNAIGSGSGSDKRVGFINTVALSASESQVLFEPLYVIKRFNGWPRNLKFFFRHQLPTTLDKDKTGTTTKIEE